jgi:hypothetical protein
VDYTGLDVMILRPAIINLDVTATDLKSASMSTTIARPADSMMLYLELLDSDSFTVFRGRWMPNRQTVADLQAGRTRSPIRLKPTA